MEYVLSLQGWGGGGGCNTLEMRSGVLLESFQVGPMATPHTLFSLPISIPMCQILKEMGEFI